MRHLLLIPLFAHVMTGCMGGPPVRSVLNDPEEMARRRAETQRMVDRRLASLEAHHRAQAARDARQPASSGSAPDRRPVWDPVWNPDHRRTDCVLRSRRADIDRC